MIFGEYIVPLKTAAECAEAIARGGRELILCRECWYYRGDENHVSCGHPAGMISPDPDDYCARAKPRREE